MVIYQATSGWTLPTSLSWVVYGIQLVAGVKSNAAIYQTGSWASNFQDLKASFIDVSEGIRGLDFKHDSLKQKQMLSVTTGMHGDTVQQQQLIQELRHTCAQGTVGAWANKGALNSTLKTPKVSERKFKTPSVTSVTNLLKSLAVSCTPGTPSTPCLPSTMPPSLSCSASSYHKTPMAPYDDPVAYDSKQSRNFTRGQKLSVPRKKSRQRRLPLSEITNTPEM